MQHQGVGQQQVRVTATKTGGQHCHIKLGVTAAKHGGLHCLQKRRSLQQRMEGLHCPQIVGGLNCHGGLHWGWLMPQKVGGGCTGFERGGGHNK